MMNDVARPTLRYVHVRRLQNQISAQVRLHGPADDVAAPDVHVVTSGRDEVKLYQVRRRARISIPPNCVMPLSPSSFMSRPTRL
jgi:hypothetical protein